jgi:hypothetical protein
MGGGFPSIRFPDFGTCPFQVGRWNDIEGVHVFVRNLGSHYARLSGESWNPDDILKQAGHCRQAHTHRIDRALKSNQGEQNEGQKKNHTHR